MPAKEHFFTEEKPRSTNLERSQNVMNTNITDRFSASIVPGFNVGLEIANLTNLGPSNKVIGTVTGPFAMAGQTLIIASDTKDFVTVTFTGASLTAAAAAAQINFQAPDIVLASDDGTGKLKLTALGPLKQALGTVIAPTAEALIQIRQDSTSLGVLGLVGAAPPIDLGVDLYKVTQGQAFDANGEQVIITADSPYALTNPQRVDSQVPPVATPQSTGNSSLPFAKTVGNIDIDTFVCIQYLLATDLSVLPNVVAGFPFQYSSQVDGYQILLLGSPADVTAALAAGAMFGGFIRRADGYVSSIYPVASGSPQFQRPVFSVNISKHQQDPNAHHNEAHEHTAIDGSSILDQSGAVLIGASTDHVKIAGQDITDNLSYAFSTGVVLDPNVITDRFALLPGNLTSGPGGPIVIGAGASPDSVIARQLRTGERLLDNGKEVQVLSGTVIGTDVFTGGNLYSFTFSPGDNGLFWIVLNDDGTMGKQFTQAAFPRQKFVYGSVNLVNGKVVGGYNGFTDLRRFGSIGNINIQDGAVDARTIDATLYSTLVSPRLSVMRVVAQGDAEVTGTTAVVKTLVERAGTISDVYIFAGTPPTGAGGTGLEIDIRKNSDSSGSIFTVRPQMSDGRGANTPEGGLLMHITTTNSFLPDIGQINAASNTVIIGDRLGMYITAVGTTQPGSDILVLILWS